MDKFNLVSDYIPIKDQKRAINKLSIGVLNNRKYQVLLGVTGSGKTFTLANVINKLQLPTLVISHNKTLAAQLYQEFRYFFPDNAVSYFVSYYDYYQPEAYIPTTDTYIEKDSDINENIDKLRLAATTNLLTRKDNIVVSSVSCIYNLGSPSEVKKFSLVFKKGSKINRNSLIDKLITLQYERSEFGFFRGTFRVRGNVLDIFPTYTDDAVRIMLDEDYISDISYIDPVSGLSSTVGNRLSETVLYPAKHYITDVSSKDGVLRKIEQDMEEQVSILIKVGKVLEAHRLKQRVKYDISMLKEVGYVKGIENYSRYFDGRESGDPPYTLLEYFNTQFNKKWLLIIDESHMTFPQIRGMYNGDLSRKQVLIDYGFRLPAALDNRPLKFEEFLRKIPNFIASSATPSQWELSMAREEVKVIDNKLQESSNRYHVTGKTINKKNAKNLIPEPKNSNKIISNNGVVEQLIRPTGIPDPEIFIKPLKSQVNDVVSEIVKNTKKYQRTLVTTLTKKTAEDLSEYLIKKNIKTAYLHCDVETLERTNILDNLRNGTYDCLIGVNLLREGLDLPEVSLVAILDADKEGFLRSEVSLIQTMGRAARHVNGRVILYADKITGSMERAINEVKRRRIKQLKYNKRHNIIPKSVEKPIRDKLISVEYKSDINDVFGYGEMFYDTASVYESLTPYDSKKLINNMRREMKIAAEDLNFELAARIRNKIKEVSGK